MPWEPIDPSVGVVGGDGGDASADNDVAAENTKTGGCQTNPDADLPGSSSSAGVQSAQHDSSGVAPSSAAPLVDRQSQQSATGAANLAAGKTVATVDRWQHPATSSSISDTANPLGIGEKIAPLDDSVHRQPHQRTSSEVETPRFQNEPSPSSSVTRLPEQAAERATEPAVSLPTVTKTSRRETFGTSNTSDHMDNPLNPPEPRGAATKASATTRTSEPLTSRYERSPPSSDHSPRNNAYTHFQLPNSGSSGEEDMMDLFSPPVSSVLRIRNRGITNQVVTAASTAVVGGQHQHQGQGLVAQTPIYHQHHHQLQHSYEQAQHQYFESSVAVKPAESAPARMPVSRQEQSMPSPTRPPHSERHDRDAAFNTDIHFDSDDYDNNPSLQLSFEESPESRPRSSPIPDSASSKQSDAKREAQARFQQQQLHPPAHQQQATLQPPPPGYPPYQMYHYHYGAPPQPPGSNQPQPMAIASPRGVPPVAYHYPADGSQPQMMLPPPGSLPYPPPQWADHYFMGYPPPPPSHYQQPPPPPTPASGSRTPGKRKVRREDMNATMETAELSYEESVGGPVSPPSSKKKKDVSLGVGTWPSPAQELVRDLM
eukprot:scaffold15357_cov193-Alexandrium_tamarense.AAC.1